MRLFHVSEEDNIKTFIPRIPYREDMDKTVGLVWALTEESLFKFLTPRDCPRVAYSMHKGSTQDDKDYFFSSQSSYGVVAIENEWYETLINTTLYVYEFDTENFYFDEIAGFYVSQYEQVPINKFVFNDILRELFDRNIEVRMMENLWDLADKVKESSLRWSLCRMANAQKRL